MPAATDLIATYRNAGLCQLADVINDFYGRRSDLHRRGASFGGADDGVEHTPQKISTDISLVAIDRSDPEAHALAQTILRAVAAGLQQYLKERPLFVQVCPEQSLFIPPLFNIQHYAPGESFKAWHCDWSTEHDASEPSRRVLAWILYCNDVVDGGTEFHWQQQHVEAIRGQLALFPAGMSHVHRGRVSTTTAKTIATGWINAGSLEAYLERLDQDGQ
ncbi:MAG: 2OG-Fe(II) oxygenase [Cyanobacteriota bacterium]|nr:2OG-Fe(II) oxygenase [Cyanobacteriota bacterium]